VFGLIENLQRADLSPLEAAKGLAAFQEAEKLSTAQLAARTGLDGERVKRLLRLHRAPLVVKEACHAGVLVPVRDERGNIVAAASGEPKQQRRRLDLLASLEFTKLHAFFAERKPQSADERTRTAMQRAVADGWGLRRVQEHVQAIIKGKPEEPTATPVTKPPFIQDAGSVRIWLERLKTASSDQQDALRVLLQGLLSELSGGCEQR
jgi:ParB-like chromosome segregation protein Spo0J